MHRKHKLFKWLSLIFPLIIICCSGREVSKIDSKYNLYPGAESVFAILKAEYNNITQQKEALNVGIVGVANLVSDSVLLTAFHVAQIAFTKGKSPYRNAQVWLLNGAKKIAVELRPDNSTFFLFPSIDVVLIKLNKKVGEGLVPLKLGYNEILNPGDSVWNYAFDTRTLPAFNFGFAGKQLLLKQYNLDRHLICSRGVIEAVERRPSTKGDSVRNVLVYKTSFKVAKGFSGSALINEKGYVGMVAFGFPASAYVKDSSYAVSNLEIIKDISESSHKALLRK